MKGLVRVHFLDSLNRPDSPPKKIYLVLNYSTRVNCKLSRCMSGPYANEIGSRNYNDGGFSVVKHPYLLEIALYC